MHGLAPDVVSSHIGDFVQLLLSKYSVHLVIWCQVTPRMTVKHHVYHNADFNENAALLNQYMHVVLEPLPRVICWKVFPYQVYLHSYQMGYILIAGANIDCIAAIVELHQLCNPVQLP